MSQELFFYLDDSGVLHKNSHERFFIYAGYVFLSKKEKDAALAKYRRLAKKIKGPKRSELKAFGTKGQTKRRLVSVLQDHESLSCIVDKNRVYDSILDSKRSIHRYKDYCLKRVAKAKIIDLIKRGLIDPNQAVSIRFFIDNQPTSTDGIYNLKESIREELATGIANFDYGVKYEPIFTSEVFVETTFCDSSKHYLIQASDMLANAIFVHENYDPMVHHQQNHLTKLLLP